MMDDLIDFSFDSLRPMQREDGVFCYEMRQGDPLTHGRSLRYTLMVLLGLQKAELAGYSHDFDTDALRALLWRELGSPELAAGDIGLYLWVDARGEYGEGEDLVHRLRWKLFETGGMAALEGQELGWIVLGLAHNVAEVNSAGASKLLELAVDQLVCANQAPNGLFRHSGTPGARRRFPNFATQIYGTLALATAGRHGLDDRALPAARAAADRLLALQLPDGGWPWLFDTHRGCVLERYPIFSVHQHAMAPMGLFELAEATGEERYAEAAWRGLDWIYGRNESSVDMVDVYSGLVLRSIRRPPRYDRISLWSRTAAAIALGSGNGGEANRVDLNRTDRPYSFGWVLEAWCGREPVAQAAATADRWVASRSIT
jgi:hypothetical protein